jgi:hypothetical protein
MEKSFSSKKLITFLQAGKLTCSFCELVKRIPLKNIKETKYL